MVDRNTYIEGSVADPAKQRQRTAVGRWRNRYEGSAAQDLIKGLGDVEFGNWIILFGASFLLSFR